MRRWNESLLIDLETRGAPGARNWFRSSSAVSELSWLLITAFQLIRVKEGEAWGWWSRVPLRAAPPTVTPAASVPVLQAALLTVPGAVSPPGACPSGSVAGYQSVLTGTKAVWQCVKGYPQNPWLPLSLSSVASLLRRCSRSFKGLLHFPLSVLLAACCSELTSPKAKPLTKQCVFWWYYLFL